MTKQILKSIYELGAAIGAFVLAHDAALALWPIDKVEAVVCALFLVSVGVGFVLGEIERLTKGTVASY